MATRRYSLAPGDALPYGIVEAAGAATVTKCIEVTIDLANVVQGSTKPLTRQDVIQALAKLTDYLVQSPWPPA